MSHGPDIVILAGDHNTLPVGKFMGDITESDKLPCNDVDIIIEEDVWIGGRAIILNGVHIGRGAVIGAGSVVRSRVPPYSLVIGNPARAYRLRGTVDQILAHETKLYPPERRLTRERLKAIESKILADARRWSLGPNSGASWRAPGLSIPNGKDPFPRMPERIPGLGL